MSSTFADVTSRLAAFREGTPWTHRLAGVTLATLLCSEWSRRVVKPLSLADLGDEPSKKSSTPASNRRRRRVLSAVASVVPLVAFFAVAPLTFDPRREVMSRAISVFVLLWLGSFKVVGLVLGRGPLCEPFPPAQFAFVFAAPVNPVVESGGGSKATRATSLRRVPSRTRIAEPLKGGALRRLAVAAAKVALLAPVVSLLKKSRESPGSVPSWLVPYLYIAGLYSVLGMMMDGGGAAAGALVGLKLSPHFDTPYFATSYADLWARRWNLVAGHSLRFLPFEVVAEGRLVKPARDRGKPLPRISLKRRLWAMAASFAVSGLVHEVELLYVLPGVSRWTGCWFLFFSGWALVLAAEKGVKTLAQKALSSSTPPSKMKKLLLSPPQFLVTPFVVVTSMAYATVGFLPPPVEQGIAERVMDSAAWVVRGLLRVDV